jgi:hypothetical protein
LPKLRSGGSRRRRRAASGSGHSLASIASWADDAPDTRPETSNWHFVDMPLAVRKYSASRDCAKDPKSGFCIVAELDALRNDLRCASGNDQVEALKFAVHFVGDIHQPLHTVGEAKGGNDIKVDLFMRGLTCSGTCEPGHIATNFPVVDWAEETHALAPVVWNRRPADDALDDRYLREILPILDRQLGVAGLRLAKFLNEAFSSHDCPVR